MQKASFSNHDQTVWITNWLIWPIKIHNIHNQLGLTYERRLPMLWVLQQFGFERKVHRFAQNCQN